MAERLKVLFDCRRKQWRGPTAEGCPDHRRRAAMLASVQGCVLFGTDGGRNVRRHERVSFKELEWKSALKLDLVRQF